MNCQKIKDALPDVLFETAPLSPSMQAHIDGCANCRRELEELRVEFRRTMELLDEWTAPEPSPYFMTRTAARFREERDAAPAGFLEQIRSRFQYGNNLRARPLLAGALAVVVVLGGGSYAGFTLHEQHSKPQVVSATVNDLQLLDKNDQLLHELDTLDQDDSYTPAEN